MSLRDGKDAARNARSPAAGDARALLERYYAAELAYLAAAQQSEDAFEDVARCLDSNIVLYEAAGLPFGGTWHGHAGIRQFFAEMSQHWESFAVTDREFIIDGDTAVVLNHVSARASATGKELSFPILQLARLKNGRITEIRPFYWDTAAIADACRRSNRP
jgi:uncharacterized protein